jgi:hypothetical protein
LPVRDFQKLVREYQDAVKGLFYGDLKAMIKGFIVSFLSFFLFLTSFAYPVLNNGVGRNILLEIRNPSRIGRGRKGPDLVKIMTLGMFNLESEMKLSRLILVNFVVLILIVVMVKIG